MKKHYSVFSGYAVFSVAWIVILCCFAPMYSIAQLRFSEISGDSGNNDGTNDGIVELINTSPTPYDASCYVISNAEWIVILPPGTIIDPGEVFLIACSEGQNNGANPNPVRGSGLTCATCDFPNMPIDFDVCDLANADYVDWAATGFTIDNQADGDGDQLVLFAPDGSIVQAVQWGGGATNVGTDNVAVQSGAYDLGTPGSGGGGLSSAELPASLLPGGTCYQMGITYTMPIITDAVYEDLTNVPNPGGKALNNSVLQGCNSSFVYDPATDSWQKTDYPNPGQPNDALAYQFSFSAPLVQCASTITDITVTLEVYNWQAVTPGTVNAKGGVGSFVSFDGGATQISWNTYNRNDATGITTFTYTFTPSGHQTLSVVWDDDKSSPLASTPTGSASATAVVNNSTPSDCYTIEQYEVAVVSTLSISDTDISCPDNFAAGIVNIGALTSGGLNVTYELFDDGVSQGTNGTGIFSIPNTLTGPITVVVTDASGCSNPIMVNIDNSCRQAPVCPTNLAYDACTTAAGDVCPGDEISLSLTADNLPEEGILEWVSVDNPTDDPYTNGEVIATQNIIKTTIPPNCPTDGSQLVINRVIIRPAMNDGGGGDEYFQLVNLGPCSIDISGYRFTYGSSGFGSVFTYTVPNGLVLPCGDFLSVNSNVAFSNSNGGFWLVNSANEVIQSIGYGSGSSGGMSGGINYPATTNNLSFPSSSRGIYLTANCVYAANNVEIPFTTFGLNSSAVGGQCPLSCSGTSTTSLEPACATYIIPANACNSTIHVRPRIVPVDAACSDPTLPALSYDIVCPTANLTGGGTACAGNIVPLTIDFENYTGTPTFTINYTKNGIAQTPIVTTDDPYVLDVNASGEYILTGVYIDGGNCTATASGAATVEINNAPMVTLSGTIDEVCIDGFVNAPLMITQGTLPMLITYDIDGGTPQTVEIFSEELFIPTTGLAPNTVYTINITAVEDANGCTGTASGSAAINTLNCNFTCPAITTLTVPGGACVGGNFDIEATDLANMAIADNGEADFGIAFVYFVGTMPPADPYTGGTLLGMVGHADLTGITQNQMATLQSVNIGVSGTYQICAILDTPPTDGSCRPAVCQTIRIVEPPALTATPANDDLCVNAINDGNGDISTMDVQFTLEAMPNITLQSGEQLRYRIRNLGLGVMPTMIDNPNVGITITATPVADPDGYTVILNPGDAQQVQIQDDIQITGDLSSFTQPVTIQYAIFPRHRFADGTYCDGADIVVTATITPPVLMDAGQAPAPICSTKKLALADLNAFMMQGGQPLGGTWSIRESDSQGQFLDANMQPLANADFDQAVFFRPGAVDAMRGYVTLVLTSDDPQAPCQPVQDEVVIAILKVDCGNFPWNGNE